MRKVIPPNTALIPEEATKVFQGVIYDVYHWPQPMFDGRPATFEMLKRPDTVSVIAVVDGQLLVINDEQPHYGAKLTFPGGRVDPGDESTLAAAQREMHEETGYSFKNWRLVHAVQPHPKIEQFVYVYLAWDVLNKESAHVDRGEKITLELMGYAQVKQLSREGKGYLGESRELLARCRDLPELLDLPEFTGEEVDR